jgi:type I restriction enzyme S subunit
MKNNWPIKKLDEFVIESKEKAGDSFIPVWSVSNNLGFVPSGEYFKRSVASEKTNNYKIVRPNYFAFNPSRINVGSIAVNKSDSIGIVSPMYTVGKIQSKILLLNFFALFIGSNFFKEQVKHFAIGGVRQILRFNDFARIEIPVPPLKIQQKIVERLDATRKAQELNDLQISKTDELFESVINKLILNKNFPTKRLGDIAQIISGQSPKSENYNKVGDGLPLYQGKRDFGSMFTADPEVWTTEKTKVAQKGDILISVRAPVGPINLANCKMNIGRGLAAIRPWEDVNYLYLFYYLHSQEKNIASLGSGSTFQSINRSLLENIKIPTPSLKIQQKIVQKLNAVQEYKKSLLKQKDLLKELFESVLDKAFKGELVK